MGFSTLWSVTGLALLLAGQVMSDCHTSNGVGGDTCGPEGRKCMAGHATCDAGTGRCVCDSSMYAYGFGYTNCYRGNTFRTEISNDPNVISYNNNSVGLPIPCRYLWTHTKSFLKNKKRDRVGFCDVQAHVFHQKHRGKFYVAGYDVAIKVDYDDGTVIQASIRKYGEAQNGNYLNCINATDNQYLPNGPWGNDEIKYYDPATNLLIKCQHDDDNNLALLNIVKCGVSINFRPYDVVGRRNQKQVPYVSYEANCAFHPEFFSQDIVAAISPATDHQGGPTIDGYLLPGLNRQETLIYRAINSGAVQNGPHGTDQCAIAKDVMATCSPTELDEAFENCMWILNSPRFIRCYDPSISGEGIMELFNRCFTVYCDGGNCNDLIADVVSTDCHGVIPQYPDIIDFVSGMNCPP